MRPIRRESHLIARIGWLRSAVLGAGVMRPTIRVMSWGTLAMALTTGIGALFGKVV